MIKTFDFKDYAVRVVERAGAPWFVAADVCRVLDLSNVSMAVADLDEDERCLVSRADMTVSNTEGQRMALSNTEGQSVRGGAQHYVVISESGLYTLIFKSRKPEAKLFRKWVTSEVLPCLRKTGHYETRASLRRWTAEDIERMLMLAADGVLHKKLTGRDGKAVLHLVQAVWSLREVRSGMALRWPQEEDVTDADLEEAGL